MKLMKLFLAVALFLSLSGRGLWATDYTFSFSSSNGGDSGSGVLTTGISNFTDQSLLVTGGWLYLTASTDPNLPADQTYMVIATAGQTPLPSNNPYAPDVQGVYESPQNAFWFDDLIYPGQNAASGVDEPAGATPGSYGYVGSPSYLTNFGLLFGSASGDQINIWGNGGATNYAYYTGTADGNYIVQDGGNGTFQLTATPEPVSMVLFGSFLSLAGGVLSRKKRVV